MRITRVYTKTGDKGTTGLADGTRVKKTHSRIEAFGTVDELNAVLGMARQANAASGADPRVVARLDAIFHQVQNDLFNLGADLATPPGVSWEALRIAEEDVGALEDLIDALNEELPPLREFILPGGGPVGAPLHLARTVCRRAERRTLEAMEAEEAIGTLPLQYLNRLSDLLFVLGRWSARALQEPEHLWER